jgi:hypothetical protein
MKNTREASISIAGFPIKIPKSDPENTNNVANSHASKFENKCRRKRLKIKLIKGTPLTFDVDYTTSLRAS